MQTSLFVVLPIAAAMLLGNAIAQTPAAKPATSTQATTPATPKAPAAKKPATAAKPATALTLKTQKDKTSYAVGIRIGTGLHQQGLPVDPSLVARGLRDAMLGNKPLMTDQEMQTVLTQLQSDLRAKQAAFMAQQQAAQKEMEAKAHEAGLPNRKAGDEFLAANKSKEGVVALPSGLQYKILTQGTGAKPAAGDKVKCNYRGTLIDGTEFDSSEKHGGAATFGVSQVIKGWTEALQLMPVGSKWQLFIPPGLAYDDNGPPEIGPGQTLIFEVELVAIGDDKK